VESSQMAAQARSAIKTKPTFSKFKSYWAEYAIAQGEQNKIYSRGGGGERRTIRFLALGNAC
jgi:hypothetical protein